MKRLPTITIALLILFALAGLSAYKPAEQWKTYTGEAYTISYPSSWIVYNAEATVKFLSPLEYSNDTFKENVMIKQEALTGKKADLDDFSEKSEKVLSKSVDQLVIVSQQRYTDEHGEYHEVIFKGSTKDLKGEWIQHYRIKDNTAYIITLTCREKTFAKYKETGLKMMNSFRFK